MKRAAIAAVAVLALAGCSQGPEISRQALAEEALVTVSAVVDTCAADITANWELVPVPADAEPDVEILQSHLVPGMYYRLGNDHKVEC